MRIYVSKISLTGNNEGMIDESTEIRDEGSDEGSEEFVQEVKEAVAKGDTVDRKHAHSIFVGPPGSGKSSLMYHLLRRKRKGKGHSPSTGVCNPVVIVDMDLDNPSTFHSVTVIDATWEEVKYDTSLVRQMNMVRDVGTSPHEQVQETLSENTVSQQTTSTNSSVSESTISGDTLTCAGIGAVPPTSKLSSGAIRKISNSNVDVSDTVIRELLGVVDSDIEEMIKSALKNYGGLKKLKRSYSLYLRDTGGQVEFQEMVSLLIFGPSIFLFVFRVDLDFGSKFSIEYRTNDGKSINSYTSSVTTEEAFLQCLASVHAMDTSDKAGVKTHKPLVFVVGTHKDKLDSSADEKIAELNMWLDTLILNGGFKPLVQYANKGKGQVMFTVDNNSENEEDF